MSSASDEEREKATAIATATTTLFPSVHLAPWASVHPEHKAFVLAEMSTLGSCGERLERQTWQIKNPSKPLPAGMQQAEKRDEQLEQEFNIDMHARGGAAFYGQCVADFVQHVHDISPSIKGLGRKQAALIATAAKMGVNASAIEPKPRSALDKALGRHKGSDMAGME